ncbi:MAG: M23 family metallopeptidase [Candidatus Gracilibacteria bacterium]|nr:M23 family metallopeptidase [Candidatus Gracilibacteria bacterium]
MKSYQILLFPILLSVILFPFSLNSADIYEISDGSSKILSSLNEHIIIGTEKLDSTIIAFRSGEDLLKPSIYSSCDMNQKIIYKNAFPSGNLYFIQIDFTDKSCDSDKIYIKNGDIIYTDTEFKINITDYSKELERFLDYSDSDLKKEIKQSNVSMHELDNESFALKDKSDIGSRAKRVSKIYSMNYSEFKSVTLEYIYKSRTGLRYISPVKGKVIPTQKTLIPNAGRGYRKDVTDGIHHGYDILAPKGYPVQALGDGVIVKIKRDFAWGNFSRIKRGNLNFDDKLENLDIYRGNQVWLKTLDGNITFYSHLGKISNDIYEGKVVKSGEYFGNIDKTGVPDREYKDFHLHFEIQLNPHIKDKVNSELDILRWNWFGQGKKQDWILDEQKKIFM